VARHESPRFLTRPLPGYAPDPLGLDQLERFVRHPVRAFLRERLNVSLRDKTRDFEDAIPIDLNALEQWQIADRVLQARLAGASKEACEAVELARGHLPPGHLADPVLLKLAAPLDDLVQAGRSREEAASLDVYVPLEGGRSLVGTVAGVRGDVVHTVTYSKLGAAPRLIAWLRLLSLTATWPDRPFEALTIGRFRGRGDANSISQASIRCLGPDAATREEVARTHLSAMIELFDRGMREPVPLYCKTSGAWVAALLAGKDPEKEASREWESDYNFPREDDDAEHRLVMGDRLSFEAMVRQAGGCPDDEAALGLPAVPSRFELYAHWQWDALLQNEEIVDR
jgi:exodeoxyribonuclease V gamma subunit